ncbi:laminin subunit beta-1 isoform X2 [Anthonomus grandis grandis]|uniref:laminin subunit beta-1 isoform X2 n=1 Tax=Anthonomus grandis grandis TaxID=2921223 RepID=UPI0021662464|nr:laminin subunit beta-1 isoform X2 [Anthonomus grandis grandis]
MVAFSTMSRSWLLFYFLVPTIFINAQYIPNYRQQTRIRQYPIKGYDPMKQHHPCEQSSCYPATGNLLIGRENQLYASSTCGLYKKERYCIVSHLDEERKKCFWCDSQPSAKPNPFLNHNITNIVYKMYPGTRTVSWWQSENGKENVYIQLDLEAEFHFTHLIITFKTFRPAAMLIERSYDFGANWQVYRYFAQNCTQSFPHVRVGDPRNLTDVICESRYSLLSPATDGEVIYRVLPPTMPIDNPYSPHVQNLLKMTNLRINFTKLHTLGDDLLDPRGEIQEKYYYAITDMIVRGSCSCYGHASRCLPLQGIEPKPDMVHGRCECTHNTKGRNCEECEDFFNDLPWRPAIGKQSNACKRCNCNNHANSCHFDKALFEAKGNVSGGVCDGCMHNTMGSNCEQCKPYYYRDPSREIHDPEVCRACDCDPRGSLEEGICDSVTDPVNNLVAGSCHCKTNIEGRRCDQCKNGFWNFTEANPDGCQPCTCNTLGTIGNQGCNVWTGECTCKRYVTGKDCQQCLPQFYNLTETQDGCQPCDCDPGGALNNFCDVLTGQCLCKNHMTGRKCDTPQQTFFQASLEFFLYEAEGSNTSGQVVIRAPYANEISPYTGIGFVKVYPGDYMEIYVNEIKTSMDYDIIIRYEPLMPESMEDIIVQVIRPPGGVDPNGPCANMSPGEDKKYTSLPSNQREQIVYPPACLEANKPYTIRIDFSSYNYPQTRKNTSVLIDAIWLRPRIENIPFFSGNQGKDSLAEFKKYDCGNPALFHKDAIIPEVCKIYHGRISAYVFDGASACNCDPTGSLSNICSRLGGQCKCKPNVVGRKCDQCAQGYYGFGPEGCTACDCNHIGAMDNACNVTTLSRDVWRNTYGRLCDQCRVGFWKFPDCVRCNCNGHADLCESNTGICISCRDNTKGINCDSCVEGFYGDPRIGIDVQCRPCPCPGLIGSNHSYADTCLLDPDTKDVFCNCQQGYAGPRCDICVDNYYGNPEVPGGSCQPCDCSGNIDLSQPGNCDPHTGKCLKCLDNTAGDHCEVCADNFYREDEDSVCKPCQCDMLGTNFTAGPCMPTGGQCQCFPNVTGLNCDECEEDHWKIASGQGCEPCECDEFGSLDTQCHTYTGQCECKPGFGGRQCNECMPRFYGDPKKECLACDCDALGAKDKQCDMRTGACICLPGVGGHKCDRCERGYIGEVPSCQTCGECFDNWDRILQESKNETLAIIERAGDIKKVGATGAYTKEFDEMKARLDEIEKLLSNSNGIDVDSIEEELQVLRSRINLTENDKLKALDNALANIKQNILLDERKVKSYNESIADLIKRTKELENNGTKLQEANVLGALTLITEAKKKADMAAHKAEHSKQDVNYADNQCRATETFINQTKEVFTKQSEDNANQLGNIRQKLDGLFEQIVGLNDLVCDGAGDPCDSICGGAGCNSCGNSISCEDGAKQLAEAAIAFAKKTETALKDKESAANDLVRNVSQINTNETLRLATETYELINKMLIDTNSSLEKAALVMKEMREFMGQNNTKPEEIKKLAQEILGKSVHKTEEEVQELADNIRDALQRLKNTDHIIEETRSDLDKVKQLKQNAEYAKLNATKLLTDAEAVNQSLYKTQDAQSEAEKAIEKAWKDYDATMNILNEIGNKTKEAESNEITRKLAELKENISYLQKNITENENSANRTIEESAHTLSKAEKTWSDSEELQGKYKVAREQLNETLNKVDKTKERAMSLSKKALDLFEKVSDNSSKINELQDSNQDAVLMELENLLKDLIDKMNGYTKKLENKVEYYNNC